MLILGITSDIDEIRSYFDDWINLFYLLLDAENPEDAEDYQSCPQQCPGSYGFIQQQPADEKRQYRINIRICHRDIDRQ